MPTFQDTEKLYRVIGGFLKTLADTPAIADGLLQSRLVLRFRYTKPDGVIVIDCSGEKIDVRPGDDSTPAVVEMTMKADLAHKYWFGKVNLTMAMATGKIRASGPIPKMLKLLPLVKPAYALYGPYLKENGFSDLII